MNIYDVFYMLLFKQNTMIKEQVDGKVLKLEFFASCNKEYKVKAI